MSGEQKQPEEPAQAVLMDCSDAELVVVVPRGRQVPCEHATHMQAEATIAGHMPWHLIPGVLRQIADGIERGTTAPQN